MSVATDRAASFLKEYLAVEHGVHVSADEARVVIDRMEDAGVLILADSGVRRPARPKSKPPAGKAPRWGV